MSKMPFQVRKADWNNVTDHDRLLHLRMTVFVEEQGVPRELELDEDDATAFHFIAEDTATGDALGCIRLCTSGQVSRLCVLKPYRNDGIGSALLQRAIVEARREQFREVHLHAQTHATSFYENNGFIPNGGIFMEAGIPHRMMVLAL